MYKIKRYLRRCFYKIKFFKNNLQLGRGTDIGDFSSHFEGSNRIGLHSYFRGSIGFASYIGNNSHINATIGRYTCISDRVNIISGTHPSKGFVSIHPAFYSKNKRNLVTYSSDDFFQETLVNPIDKKTSVYIGNDVWIGSDVTIIGGVKIGDGAIIGACSLVNKDVEPYSIVVGTPAREIKKRFNEKQIQQLIEFKWWNKSSQWLQNNSKLFLNIDEFIRGANK